MPQKYAQALLWTDFETTDLPRGNDYSTAHVMEVAVVVTDFSLTPITGGYHEAIKFTRDAVESLRGNEYTREMHKKNGLIEDCKKSTFTLGMVEETIVKILQEETSFEPGEFMIAGSGVAAFDHPLIKHWMPNLAKWLAYYPFDIGVMRRTSKILAGNRDVVNIPSASYGDAKAHRAMDDVKAHLEEAKRFQTWFHSVT